MSTWTPYYVKSAVMGILAGIGTGSLYSLIHNVRTRVQEEKEFADPDQDSIVLTLPADYMDKTAGVRKGDIPAVPWAKGLVIAALSGTLSASAVVQAYHRHRRKELLEELEGVKEEYLDELLGRDDYSMGLKEAEFIKRSGRNKPKGFFSEFGVKRKPGIADRLIGVLLLGTLVGGSGIAYLTKRILDSHQRALDDKSPLKELPKVKRVVIRTEETGAPKKEEPVVTRPPSGPSLLDIERVVDEVAQAPDVYAPTIKAAFWNTGKAFIEEAKSVLGRGAELVALQTYLSSPAEDRRKLETIATKYSVPFRTQMNSFNEMQRKAGWIPGFNRITDSLKDSYGMVKARRELDKMYKDPSYRPTTALTKTGQLLELKELLFPEVRPTAISNADLDLLADRINEIVIDTEDPNADKYLTDERQEIIRKSIRKALRRELLAQAER